MWEHQCLHIYLHSTSTVHTHVYYKAPIYTVCIYTYIYIYIYTYTCYVLQEDDMFIFNSHLHLQPSIDVFCTSYRYEAKMKGGGEGDHSVRESHTM